MTLILCIDDKKGMTFGGKRQSRDSAVTERILSLTDGKRLVLSPYSAPLFPDKKELVVAEDPAEAGKADDFLFIENTSLPEKAPERIILFHWNRRYPATSFFTLSTDGYALSETREFKGSSHDCITEESWELK